jgi:hypothetical protein
MLSDREQQAHIHEVVDAALRETGIVSDEQLLTGWVLAYETVMADGQPTAGHLHGPAGRTTWNALGLLEWIRRFTLRPDDDEDDDDA